jgi:hypothetical protein
MTYQNPEPAKYQSGAAATPKKQGVKMLLAGLACVALTIIGFVALDTWYVWLSVIGAAAVVAGIVMIALKK